MNETMEILPVVLWVILVIVLLLIVLSLHFLRQTYKSAKEYPEQLSDEERGLYRKYHVRKLNDREEKHKNCFFFVLDMTHDPFAIPAARAYADACRGRFPILAQELESFNPAKPRMRIEE